MTLSKCITGFFHNLILVFFFLFKLIFSQVVVSAGVFRVFGPEVAELPLVATDAEYQGQVI
jgi:hypothetical protein